MGLMKFHENERAAVLIDGQNLYGAIKALGFEMDFRKLIDLFDSEVYLLKCRYYTTVFEDQEYLSIRPLLDWLEYNSIKVVTKPAKEFIDASGRRKVKASMDVEIAIDAMELAQHVNHIVLFSGDGDFCPVVEAVQRRGCKVTVVSTLQTQPSMVADDLRRVADHFVDLADLQAVVARPQTDKSTRYARA